MASSAATIKMNGLAQRLVRDALLSEDEVRAAQKEAQQQRGSLVSHLVSAKKISSTALAELASHEFGIPLFDIAAMDLGAIPRELINEKLIRQHNALPLVKRGNRLFVAISDPMSLAGLDEIKFNTGLPTEPIIVEEDKLGKVINQVLESQQTHVDVGDLDADLDNVEVGMGETELPDADSNLDDTPVVRFINKVMLDAINKKASDIHFEPYEKQYRVRFRLDGILQEIASPPPGLSPRLAARLKVLSRMDLAERRVPQDGRIKLQLSKSRAIDFRVSTCPTLWGEKVVLRILD
ncbi:MAG: ATPase, T2SS/T4P/T4SS family, partial [Candidatus Binatia bacterium]